MEQNRIPEATRNETRARARRQRTKLERRQVVEETFAPGSSIVAIAKEHGVRASQVYHWRKLYRQGRLDTEAEGTALMPVRITEAMRVSGPAPARMVHGQAAVAGSIDVELSRGRLHIEGAADTCSLRVVLEYLLA